MVSDRANNSISVSSSQPQNGQPGTLLFIEEQRLDALTFALDKILAPSPRAQAIIDEQTLDTEPGVDDTVRYCPNCEKPNQFGELCGVCARAIDEEFYQEARQ